MSTIIELVVIMIAGIMFTMFILYPRMWYIALGTISALAWGVSGVPHYHESAMVLNMVAALCAYATFVMGLLNRK